MTRPAMQKPRILFMFAREAAAGSTRFDGFVKRLKKYGDFSFADADVAAIEDMVFLIDKRKAKVIDWRTKKDPADYDFVYFKNWQSMPDQAAALAVYLEAKGVPYIDYAITQRRGNAGKIITMLKLWAARIATPRTVYASPKHVADVVSSELVQYPMVIKAANGEKGQNNYLVKTAAAARKVIAEQPEIDWIIQDFIPNDGDWRVQVYGGEPAMVIKRKGSGASHLNNTSAGGTAELFEHKKVPTAVLDLAVKAAEVMDLAVSGVDVIVDKETGRKAILEVNQGSQVVTGAHIEENIQGFVKFLKRTTRRRYHRKSTHGLPKKVIGRIELVGLPEFGLTDIAAKSDTGAYSGALHAENIRLIEKGNKKELHFQIPHFTDGRTHTTELVDCVSHDFEAVFVKSSNGQRQNRYKISTLVRIQGRGYQAQFTLTNRQTQKVPMLLGRKLLRGNFLVNVELSRGETQS